MILSFLCVVFLFRAHSVMSALLVVAVLVHVRAPVSTKKKKLYLFSSNIRYICLNLQRQTKDIMDHSLVMSAQFTLSARQIHVLSISEGSQ